MQKGNHGLKDKMKVEGLSSPPSAAPGFNRFNLRAELLAVKSVDVLPVAGGFAAPAKATSKHAVFPVPVLN